MKKIILIASLFAFSAFADGIPVPMEQQTKYIWNCDPVQVYSRYEIMALQPVKLLYTMEDSTLWIQGGALVGTKLGPNASKALLSHQYLALRGLTIPDPDTGRSVSFMGTWETISATMTDSTLKIEANNCVAAF